MNKKIIITSVLTGLLLTGCGSTAGTAEESSITYETGTKETVNTETQAENEPMTEHATAPQEKVGYEGMEVVYADSLTPGSYDIKVDSSSSMFKIAACVLNVGTDGMTADIIINSKSYQWLFMGTSEEAEASDESGYISYTENEEEQSVFTVPVEALDKEIRCASLSAKKQEWYDRTLVFRADSLSAVAFKEGFITTAESLGLADGSYNAEVTLEGGSGKAHIDSPAELTVSGGEITARIVWSSSSYDYMIVDGEKYLPEPDCEFSTFDIPVSGLDYKMPVLADTTAMSVPYEIEYTLYFDSDSIVQ